VEVDVVEDEEVGVAEAVVVVDEDDGLKSY